MKTIMQIIPTFGYTLFTDLDILVLLDTLFRSRRVRDQIIFFDPTSRPAMKPPSLVPNGCPRMLLPGHNHNFTTVYSFMMPSLIQYKSNFTCFTCPLESRRARTGTAKISARSRQLQYFGLRVNSSVLTAGSHVCERQRCQFSISTKDGHNADILISHQQVIQL